MGQELNIEKEVICVTNKLLVVILCAILIILNISYVKADSDFKENSDSLEELKIHDILGKDILNNEFVSRSDCVVSVMKLIGVTEEMANEFENRDFEYPIFDDILNDQKDGGYILIAGYSNIAFGEITDGHIRNFHPNNNVTLKECIAFMLRCLKDSDTVDWGNIVPCGEEIGLLSIEEMQSVNENESITMSQFKTLLERMLNMNRYLYWPTENPQPGYEKTIEKDSSGSIRYIDWLIQKGDKGTVLLCDNWTYNKTQ